MNGLNNLLSALLSLASVLAFIAAGLIVWTHALPMAVAAGIGGYVGAALSRRITNMAALRIFVTLVGTVMTVAFFLR